MLPNAFISKSKKPSNRELAAALGPSMKLWDRLVANLADEYGVDVQEWNSYSPKAGWSLRLKHGKRTIVWLGPCLSCFRVAFILGDKAMGAARQAKLSKRVLKILNGAPRYPEGTGIRLNVKGPNDIAIVKKLAAIKLAN